MFPTKVTLAGALLLTSALFGCAIPDTYKETSQVTAEAAKLVSKAAAQSSPLSGAVEHYSYPKLAGSEIDLEALNTQPAWLNDQTSYTSFSQNVLAITKDLSERLGVTVRVTPSLMENREAVYLRKPYSIQFKGTVRGLLDDIASHADIFWRYKDGQIEFFDTETRTYHVDIPHSTRTMSGTISLGQAGGVSGSMGGGAGMGAAGGMGSSMGSTGSGGAQTSVTSTVDIDTFSAAIAGVRAIVNAGEGRQQGPRHTAGMGNTVAQVGGGMPQQAGVGGAAPAGSQHPGGSIGAGGGNTGDFYVSGTPELGLITVTTRPPVHERVQAFIKTLNEGFAQNVFIQIKVLSVTSSNDFNMGVMANLISNKGSNQVTTTNTVLTPQSGNPAGVMTFSRTSGQFTGAQVVASALSEIGDVSVVNSGQVIAINGQPAAIQVASTQSYLASTTPAVTNGFQSAGAPGLNPNSITVGFTGTFLPMIMADNRILLEYTLNLSSLTSMGQITSAGQTIQLPNIAQQSLQQQAFVQDGETIVLFGFDQDSNSSTNQTGLPAISANRNKSKQSLVIVMDVSRLKSLAK